MRNQTSKIFLFICIIVFNSQIFPQIDTFSNTPYDKWANVLVNYSLNLQPGETLLIETTELSHDLCLLIYKEAIVAGAHPYISIELSDMDEIFFNYASK